MIMLRFQLSILVLFMVFLPVRQNPTTIPEVNLSISENYKFGESVTFTAQLNPDHEISTATVYWQVVPGGEINNKPAVISSNTASYTENLAQTPIPPYSEIEYWFSFLDEKNNPTQSQSETFIYEDNRFEWNGPPERNNGFNIHWVKNEFDISFGQQASNAAENGLRAAYQQLPFLEQKLAAVQRDLPINIYIYPTVRDVQQALQLTGQSWVAGHAAPQLNTILVSVAPGNDQILDLERQIPHELMHILLYRYMDIAVNGNYDNLPTWLSEGLATLNELNPDPNYAVILYDASQSGELLPITSLCHGFPSDASQALVAYAQSAAFTSYLKKQYGASGIEELLDSYADGLECERGAEKALGVNLTGLEQQWITDTFGIQTTPPATDQAYTWLILLGVIVLLPLFSILLIRRKSASRDT